MGSLAEEYKSAITYFERAIEVAEEFADYASFLERTLIERTGMTREEIWESWRLQPNTKRRGRSHHV